MLQRHKNILQNANMTLKACVRIFYDYYLFGRLGMRLSTKVYRGQSILHELPTLHERCVQKFMEFMLFLKYTCDKLKYNFVAIHGGQFSFVTFYCNLIPILHCKVGKI